MRILYAQAVTRLARSATTAFRSQLFAVDLVDAAHLTEHAPCPNCDAIVLDMDQSPERGMFLVRQLRAKGVRAPVVVFNGCRSPDERINLINAGADDCIPDPISLEE